MDPKDITLENLKEKFPQIVEAMKKEVGTALNSKFEEKLKTDLAKIKTELSAKTIKEADEVPSTGNGYQVSLAQVVKFLKDKFGASWVEGPDEESENTRRQGKASGTSYANDEDRGNTGLDKHAEQKITALEAANSEILKEMKKLNEALEVSNKDKYVSEALSGLVEWKKKVILSSLVDVKTEAEAKKVIEAEIKKLDIIVSNVPNAGPAGLGRSIFEDGANGTKTKPALTESQKVQMTLAGITVPKGQ